MFAYYARVLRKAVLLWTSRLSRGIATMTLFVIQTAVIFLILYMVPPLGDLVEHGRSAVLTAIAVAVSALVTLLWDLLRAPAMLDKQHRDEIDRLRRIVDERRHQEAVCTELSALLDEGMALYHQEAPFDAWCARMEDWSTRVASQIDRHLTITARLRFRHPFGQGGVEWRTDWTWDGVEPAKAFAAKARYTAQLTELREVIFDAPFAMKLRDGGS